MVVIAAITAFGCGSAVRLDPPVAPQADEELGRIGNAVAKALTSSPPRGYAAVPDGVRLLGVDRRADGTIVLNFSEELLVASERRLEDALQQILMAAADARAPGSDPNRQGADNRFLVLVNGVALDAYRR